MQVLLMTKQAETCDEAHQSEIVIAVKMGNKNMGDLTAADLVFYHLYLRAFTTINQIIIAIKRYYLAGRVTIKCRYRRVISEDCY